MPLYDFLAPAYDLAFENIHRSFRERALENMPAPTGSRVLDLACGTGQNFPLLSRSLGPRGQLIGLDISAGMLHYARNRTTRWIGSPKITLIRGDAAHLRPAWLKKEGITGLVDFVLCTYGFTSMRDPESAFRASWGVLKPGGIYGILDIHAARPTLHARAVEWSTLSSFTDRAWRPLRDASPDFRMDYLDPSAHLFGGRLFVAWGTKPQAVSPSPTCPS